MQPIMTADEINAFLETDFPQIHTDGRVFHVTEVSPGRISMTFDPAERHLRPGGTVSGPAMFALADVAAYAAVLAHIGPVGMIFVPCLDGRSHAPEESITPEQAGDGARVLAETVRLLDVSLG